MLPAYFFRVFAGLFSHVQRINIFTLFNLLILMKCLSLVAKPPGREEKVNLIFPVQRLSIS